MFFENDFNYLYLNLNYFENACFAMRLRHNHAIIIIIIIRFNHAVILKIINKISTYHFFHLDPNRNCLFVKLHRL